MRLLKSQLQALAEVAEQDAETPEECAENIVAKVDDLRGDKSYYSVICVLPKLMPFTFGPYSTANQAHRAAEKASPVIGGKWYLANMLTPEGLDKKLIALTVPPKVKGDLAVVAEDAQAFKNGWDGKQKNRAKFL